MPTNRHFDLLAPLYDRVMRAPDPTRLRSLLELPVPGLLLDAGGGTGRLARALCGGAGRWVICDLSLPMLRQAKGSWPGDCAVRLNLARAERLPFPANRFDRIVVVDAFHHFADQPGAARELARVLRPGGRLVIEEPDIRRPWVKLIALAETLAGMGSRFRRGEEIAALLAAGGLRARAEDDGNLTVWAIAEKE